MTKKLLLALLCMIYFGSIQAQTWDLVWSDEFNYTGAPDASKWNYDIWAPGQVNNEYQAYTNRSENVRVEGGNLVIEGRHDYGNGYEYTSGRINSSGKGKFTYGRMEARMKLPGGLGTWPAFWMMPNDAYKYATTCNASTGWTSNCDAWPNSGEIDIMEYVGYDFAKIHGSVHSKNFYFKLGNQRTGTINVSNPETNFHVYAVEWFADRIDFFVDNSKYYTVYNDGTGWASWPFNHDFFVIFNLAIGGDWGAAGGFNPSVFEPGAKMLVDYVRVFKAGVAPTLAIPGTICAKSFSSMSGIQTEATSDGNCGTNVGYIDAGDWMAYNVNVASAGTYKVDYRVASPNGGGVIRLEKAGGGTVYGTINVPSTGGWQNWSPISHNVTLTAGSQQIAIAIPTGGYNLNSITFTKVTAGAPIGSTIWLKGSNGKFVTSMNGVSAMMCDRTSVQGWEQFKIVDAGSGKIGLQGSNGKYVSSVNGATSGIVCDRTSIQGWETFTWIDRGNGTIALQGSNGQYITSANGTAVMKCNATTIQGWETFTWGTGAGTRMTDESGNNLISIDEISIYPNPASGEIKINAKEFDYVKILDMGGKVMIERTLDQSSIQIGSLRAGIYFVVLTGKQQKVTRKLLVK